MKSTVKTLLAVSVPFALTMGTLPQAANAGSLSPRDVYSDGARDVRDPRNPFVDGARDIHRPRNPFVDGARDVREPRNPFVDGARFEQARAIPLYGE
ncbi:hypothetical protein DFLDMN_003901 [Cupriavidus sp. H19C3]|uniref:hydroxyquinol 1,2-dioxygenase n=1 Tax=Cupriavidus sp. H19C3 TaxID=3241603 RepID=UPI003BF804B8